MPTPKFDRTAKYFIHKIKGEFSENFTPGTEMPDADFLTKEEVEDYINRGLKKFFEQAVVSSGFDPVRLGAAFPELIRASSPTISADNKIILPDAGRLYKIINVKFVNRPEIEPKIKDASERLYYEETNNEFISPTESEPIVFRTDYGGDILPRSFGGDSIIVDYVINYLTESGTLITQNGNYDIQFSEKWLEEIAELATSIYKKDALEES